MPAAWPATLSKFQTVLSGVGIFSCIYGQEEKSREGRNGRRVREREWVRMEGVNEGNGKKVGRNQRKGRGGEEGKPC